MKITLLTIFLCAAILASTGAALAQDARSRVRETTVTIFDPPVPKGEPREGSCLSASKVVRRAAAWRCADSDQIYDPCFSAPHHDGMVVCGANPMLKSDGFALKLTQPLPGGAVATTAPEPWVLEVADGSSCIAITGNAPIISGANVKYACAKPDKPGVSAFVITELEPGTVWLARTYPQWVVHDPHTTRVEMKGEIVELRKVWK